MCPEYSFIISVIILETTTSESWLQMRMNSGAGSKFVQKVPLKIQKHKKYSSRGTIPLILSKF
jgi:hypothetical protein